MFSDEELVAAFADRDWSVELPVLGEGSFKLVYRADGVDGEDVVLKLIKEPISADEQDEPLGRLPERFIREISGMKAVRSPRVVSVVQGPEVIDIGNQRFVWYAEPRLPGGDLTSRGGSHWDDTATAQLMLDLVEGAKALEDNGLVHRDIKPDNVVFDDEDRPVLIDLGIALHLDAAPLTRTGQASPRTDLYAAPEQFGPRPSVTIDFRTDLFAIGILAFELRTGEHPYFTNQVEVAEYFNDLSNGNWKRDSLDAADVGPALRTVLGRLLSPELNRRYRKLAFAQTAIEGCL